MLGGAAILGRVALGLMLIFGSLLVGVDGLLRHEPARTEEPALPEPIQRWASMR